MITRIALTLFIAFALFAQEKPASKVFDPADINRDGVVDCRDVNEIKDVILGKMACPTDHHCDANNDGRVNVADLQTVINKLTYAEKRTGCETAPSQ